MRHGPILIVDDDQAVLELYALALSDTHQVRTAGTADEAITVLHCGPLGAVVLDYRLANRSGLDVLTDIRSEQPDLPVIMVTGYGSEGLCMSAFRLGVVDYLPKPVNVFELARSVQHAICPELVESWPSPEPPAQAPSAGTADAARQRLDLPIQKAVQVIQHRYWDSLSLTDLARETGMSKYWFSHRFHQVIGIPFREYLLRVRLDRAKDLLAAGHASITEVAQSVGFSDLPRFDKLFRRHTGLTPSAYRSASPPRSNN